MFNLDKCGYASDLTNAEATAAAVRAHWEQLPGERQQRFRFHHISTDEVFGSLGASRPLLGNHSLRPAQPLFSEQGGLCSPTAATTTAPGSSPRS